MTSESRREIIACNKNWLGFIYEKKELSKKNDRWEFIIVKDRTFKGIKIVREICFRHSAFIPGSVHGRISGRIPALWSGSDKKGPEMCARETAECVAATELRKASFGMQAIGTADSRRSPNRGCISRCEEFVHISISLANEIFFWRKKKQWLHLFSINSRSSIFLTYLYITLLIYAILYINILFLYICVSWNLYLYSIWDALSWNKIRAFS